MRILVMGLLCLFTLNVYGQGNVYKIEKEAQNIKIDGKLNETGWGARQAFGQFHNHFPLDSGATETNTEVKAFHDGETLYFGVTITEPTEDYIVRSLKRDEGFDSFITGDGFALIIDVSGQQNSGYFFGINVRGAQTDGLISIVADNYMVDASWNVKWQSETYLEGNKRYYEVAIPFSALAFDPDINEWKINFATIDGKTPQYTTLTPFSRNYSILDLRFTAPVIIPDLPIKKTSRLSLIPSVVASYDENLEEHTEDSRLSAGLDVKYAVTSSLKLDATLNPDFSQIEQDQQIANLTRFDISFPERRNFFLENGDLFNNLGARGVNPFYSRIIGSQAKMLFGVKLSGKISKNSRIGVLNAQTEETETTSAQNFTTLVARHNITDKVSATSYMVNRQEVNNPESSNTYNRVLGLNLNYIAGNKKWLGQFNYGKSLTPTYSNQNNFLNTTLSYSTRKWQWTTNFVNVQKNFITDVGFVPRLYNFDAILQEMTRLSYWENYTEVIYNQYVPQSRKSDKNEYKLRTNSFYNADLELIEEELLFIYFRRYRNQSYFFTTLNYNHNNLQFATDILRNGNPLPADVYNTSYIRVGYISSTNRQFSFQNRLQYGSFYNGDRFNWEFVGNYRIQPRANLGFDYNLNIIDLEEYGDDVIHTLNFNETVFINKQLSWTNIVQYNTRSDNFSYNTRLQWEFKPLSYVYLVFTDGYTAYDLERKNYSLALKINYWLDL